MIMLILITGIFLGIALFYYMAQKRRIRNEQRRIKSREKFTQLLSTLEPSPKTKNKTENGES
jgi:hypothetical protein